jgi:hypothetical protein
MRFELPDGDGIKMSLSELQRAPIGFDIGLGHIHVDSTEVKNNERQHRVLPHDAQVRLALAFDVAGEA